MYKAEYSKTAEKFYHKLKLPVENAHSEKEKSKNLSIIYAGKVERAVVDRIKV